MRRDPLDLPKIRIDQMDVEIGPDDISREPETVTGVTIGVTVQGASSGFLVLDCESDLFLLREKIDKYISEHEIKEPETYE